MQYDVEATADVVVTINDPDVIARCVENKDDRGVPQPRTQGGTGWRDHFYDLDTPQKVIAHLAYNAVANGLTDLRGLDGWADLPHDAATMRADVDVDPRDVFMPATPA